MTLLKFSEVLLFSTFISFFISYSVLAIAKLVMKQLTVNSFNRVCSITFVLYKSHFSVCEFDHIPMLKMR